MSTSAISLLHEADLHTKKINQLEVKKIASLLLLQETIGRRGFESKITNWVETLSAVTDHLVSTTGL